MWFFSRERKKKCSHVKKLITGIIIGGAIASILGKKVIEKLNEESEEARDEEESTRTTDQ